MVKFFLAQEFFFMRIDILRGVKMWESEGFVICFESCVLRERQFPLAFYGGGGGGLRSGL